MPEHQANDTMANAVEPINPTVSFEPKDVSVTGVERVGLGLGVVIVIVLAVSAVAFHFLTRVQPVGTPEVAASMRPDEHALPPAPRMQAIPGDTAPPPEQQREFQAAAAAELHTYGWMDGQHSVAHIPIEDAMAILVKNGSPQAAPPQVAAHGKSSAPAAKRKKGP
jgi:hypothetical protein